MKYIVRAYPFALQYGTIEIPDDVPEGELNEYIETHWENIKFDEPELDYTGTDFEYERRQ